MSASSDPPSIQVQVCHFIAEYRFWMVFGVLGTSTLNAIPSVEINSESSRSQSDIQTDWSGCSYPYIYELWPLQSIHPLKREQHSVVFSWWPKGTHWGYISVCSPVLISINFVWYPGDTSKCGNSSPSGALHAILPTLWRYTYFLLGFHVHIIRVVLYNVHWTGMETLSLQACWRLRGFWWLNDEVCW